MQIFVLVNGEQQGPYSVDQIKGYLAMGQFQHSDMAWREGLPEWQPLGQFPEFPARTHRTPNYKSVAFRKVAPKKSGRGKSILANLAFVVVFAAAGGGGYYFWRQHQQAAGGSSAAPAATTDSPFASGTAGIPKTLNELNAWYEEPAAGQNAATYFEKGFEAMQMDGVDWHSPNLPISGNTPLPYAGNPVPAAMKTAVRAFVEQNRSALDQFERGAPFSGSRYSIDLTQGFSLHLKHVTNAKMAARLAALDAMMQADSHNGTNAVADVLLALASAQTLRSEPILISQIARGDSLALAVDALEQVVNRVGLHPDSLAQLQSAFAHAADAEADGLAFNRAFVGDRVMALAALDLPPDKLREELSELASGMGKGADNFQAFYGEVPEKFLAQPKDQRKFIENSLNEILSARKEPFPARLKADELMATRGHEAIAKAYPFAAFVLGFGPNSNAVPIMSTTAQEATGLARLRLAQTAIALELYRAANGNKYPNSLNELAPKFLATVPNDPFDGQPVRYLKGAQGYLLHSIGPDLRDDGGARKPGSDDLLFILARPPRAS